MTVGHVRDAAPGLNLRDIADGAVPDPFADQAQPLIGVALDAELGADAGLFGDLGELA